MGTEIADEKELNANQQIIQDTLKTTFGSPAGKLDVNNSSASQLADALRDPLAKAGVALSEDDLQGLSKSIEDYRSSHGGLLNRFDELSSCEGSNSGGPFDVKE